MTEEIKKPKVISQYKVGIYVGVAHNLLYKSDGEYRNLFNSKDVNDRKKASIMTAKHSLRIAEREEWAIQIFEKQGYNIIKDNR